MSRVLGIDPAMRHTGWCIADISHELPKILAAGVITTKKSAKKLNVMVADDNQRCIAEIASQLFALTAPKTGVKLIVAEQMTMPTHKNGALSVMTGVTCYTTVATGRGLPIVTVPPKLLKAALGSADHLTRVPGKAERERDKLTDKQIKKLQEQRREESKQWVQDRVLQLLAPQRRTIEAFAAKHPEGDHEHMYDAIAAVIAAKDHQLMRMLRQTTGRTR